MLKAYILDDCGALGQLEVAINKVRQVWEVETEAMLDTKPVSTFEIITLFV